MKICQTTPRGRRETLLTVTAVSQCDRNDKMANMATLKFAYTAVEMGLADRTEVGATVSDCTARTREATMPTNRHPTEHHIDTQNTKTNANQYLY